MSTVLSSVGLISNPFLLESQRSCYLVFEHINGSDLRYDAGGPSQIKLVHLYDSSLLLRFVVFPSRDDHDLGALKTNLDVERIEIFD